MVHYGEGEIMRKLGVAVALAIVLCACAAARGRPAFASVTDVLTTSGKCKVAANWSLGVTPGPYDAYVPPGKTLKAEGVPCRMRSLGMAGTITGGTVEVGNSLRAEGPAGQDVLLEVTGEWLDFNPVVLTSEYTGSPQILDFGSKEVRSVRVKGTAHYQLGEDATHFGTEFWMGEGTWFDTNGYDVGGMGWTQIGLPATLKLHDSVWNGGEWRVASSVSLEAGEATVYEDDGSYGIFEGHGQSFGKVIVRNCRPHVIESFTTGTLELDQPAPASTECSEHAPIVFAGLFLPNERPEGTIHLNALRTDGTPEEPARTEGKVTLVIPHDLTVDGCIELPEATVVGGSLTMEC